MRELSELLPKVLVVLSGVYFYFYFKRIADLAGLRTELPKLRAVLAGLAVLFVVPAWDIWGFWAVVVFHALGFSLLTEFINGIVCRAGRNTEKWRFLYRSGLLPVAALIVLLGYGWWNMHRVTGKTYSIYTEKKIREQGYRAAFLSDLHYGTTMDAERLAECCESLSRERPDFVVLGGDLVDEYTTKEELGEVFQILSGIRTRYGIYYIYGNHDRGRYWKGSDFSEEELERAVVASGIRILKDDTAVINGELTLIGRDDRTHPERGRRASAKALLDQADRETFLLLADHQPRELKENAALGYDLQISGHTHGGQVWPVGEISDLLGFGEMNYGLREIGSFQAIVSSGMAGWNYAFRTGKHSEYVLADIFVKNSNG